MDVNGHGRPGQGRWAGEQQSLMGDPAAPVVPLQSAQPAQQADHSNSSSLAAPLLPLAWMIAASISTIFHITTDKGSPFLYVCTPSVGGHAGWLTGCLLCFFSYCPPPSIPPSRISYNRCRAPLSHPILNWQGFLQYARMYKNAPLHAHAMLLNQHRHSRFFLPFRPDHFPAKRDEQ